jgi:hypothetical protein
VRCKLDFLVVLVGDEGVDVMVVGDGVGGEGADDTYARGDGGVFEAGNVFEGRFPLLWGRVEGRGIWYEA